MLETVQEPDRLVSFEAGCEEMDGARETAGGSPVWCQKV